MRREKKQLYYSLVAKPFTMLKTDYLKSNSGGKSKKPFFKIMTLSLRDILLLWEDV